MRSISAALPGSASPRRRDRVACCLALAASRCGAPAPLSAQTDASRGARALGHAHARSPRRRRSRRWCAPRSERRLQHAARAGARPRRRVLPQRPRTARRRARSAARTSIRSPKRCASRTAPASRCTPGSTSTSCRAPSELPRARQHVVYRHPEWLMVPRELAAELLDRRSAQPRVRRPARALDTRAADEVEGSVRVAGAPAARPRTSSTSSAISSRRTPSTASTSTTCAIPNDDFDYSRGALRGVHAAISAGADRRRAPARSTREESIDPLAYPTCFRERWTAFRRVAADDAGRCACARPSRRRRPDVVLSAAVFPDAAQARRVDAAGLALSGSISRCSTCSARWPTRTDVAALRAADRRARELSRRVPASGRASAPIG